MLDKLKDKLFGIPESNTALQTKQLKRICFGLKVIGIFSFIFGGAMFVSGLFILISHELVDKYEGYGILFLILGLVLLLTGGVFTISGKRKRQGGQSYKVVIKREGD